MTTINTIITPIGETNDGGNNWKTSSQDVKIYYNEDKCEVVAEWNNNAYTIDEILIVTGKQYLKKELV